MKKWGSLRLYKKIKKEEEEKTGKLRENKFKLVSHWLWTEVRWCGYTNVL